MFPLGHPLLVKSINHLHTHTHTPTVWLARSRSFEANKRLCSTCKPQTSVEETPMSTQKNKVMIKRKPGTRRKRETPQTLIQPAAHVLTTISNSSNLCQRFPIACPHELISQTAKDNRSCFSFPSRLLFVRGTLLKWDYCGWCWWILPTGGWGLWEEKIWGKRLRLWGTASTIASLCRVAPIGHGPL